MEEVQNIYQVSVRTSEGMILLDRFKHGWEDNIKMDF